MAADSTNRWPDGTGAGLDFVQRDPANRPVVETERESDIPPALTPNEWQNIHSLNETARRRFVEVSQEIGRPHAAIAILNDSLHEEDVRKLTGEYVKAIRAAAELLSERVEVPDTERPESVLAQMATRAELYSQLLELADVIESYLAQEPHR